MSKSESDRKYFAKYNDFWNDCIIRRKEADSFLSSRSRRANTGVEEIGEGNVEQECMNMIFYFTSNTDLINISGCEEYCDYEEARETYEDERKGETFQEFWKRYSSKSVVTDFSSVSPPGSLKCDHTNETTEVNTIIMPIILSVAVFVLLISLGLIKYCIWRNRRNEEIEIIGRNCEVSSTSSSDSITFNFGYEGYSQEQNSSPGCD